MAIQQINLGSAPSGAGGDTQRAANEKINQNFSNQTHAASRLVGTSPENVVLVKDATKAALGVVKDFFRASSGKDVNDFELGSIYLVSQDGNVNVPFGSAVVKTMAMSNTQSDKAAVQYAHPYGAATNFKIRTAIWNGTYTPWYSVYGEYNTTKDSNGFIKASSPVLRVYSEHIEGNGDGERMGAEFVKKGVGDYLIKGTTGLADEGWYVTVPQDANGNNLVAVEYESLENGDVVLKTYKRKFDFETVSIVADHDNPLDIPETRWIDLRFNDLPQEQLDEPIK